MNCSVKEELSIIYELLETGNIIPDLNRVWLSVKSKTESDPTSRQVYEALLQGYDAGQVTMYYDVFTGEMKYKEAEIN